MLAENVENEYGKGEANALLPNPTLEKQTRNIRQHLLDEIKQKTYARYPIGASRNVQISLYDTIVSLSQETTFGNYADLKFNDYRCECENDIPTYIAHVAHKHKNNMREFIKQLFFTKKETAFFSDGIDIVLWGCGPGLELLALYDFIHQETSPKNWKEIQSIQLYDISTPAGNFAKDLAEILFPAAKCTFTQINLKTEAEKINLGERSTPITQRVHFFANILDLFNLNEIDTLTSKISNTLQAQTTNKGNEYFILFSPPYNSVNDKFTRFAQFFKTQWEKTFTQFTYTDSSATSYLHRIFFLKLDEESLYAHWEHLARKQKIFRDLYSYSDWFLRNSDSTQSINKEAWKKHLFLLFENPDLYFHDFSKDQNRSYPVNENPYYENYEMLIPGEVTIKQDDSQFYEIYVLYCIPKTGTNYPLLALVNVENCTSISVNEKISYDKEIRTNVEKKYPGKIGLPQKSIHTLYLTKKNNKEKIRCVAPCPLPQKDIEWLAKVPTFKEIFTYYDADVAPLPPIEEGKTPSRQMEVLNSKAQYMKIKGGPGTGKTYTLLWRAINTFLRTRRPVLILSKTNSVISLLRKRLASTLATLDGLDDFAKTQFSDRHIFVSTIDMFRHRRKSTKGYAAILIDELQCIEHSSFKELYEQIQRENQTCEMYVFCDEKQTLRTNKSGVLESIDEENNSVHKIVKMPKGSRFGRFKTLNKTKRFSDKNGEIAKFCKTYEKKYLSEQYEIIEEKTSPLITMESSLFSAITFMHIPITNEDMTPLYNHIETFLQDGKTTDSNNEGFFEGYDYQTDAVAFIFERLAPLQKFLKEQDREEKQKKRSRFNLGHITTTHLPEDEPQNEFSFNSPEKITIKRENAERMRKQAFCVRNTGTTATTLDSAQGHTFKKVILILSEESDNMNEELFTAISRPQVALHIIDLTPTGRWIKKLAPCQ